MQLELSLMVFLWVVQSYPLGFVLDYWGKNVCFQTGWQSGDGRIAQLPSSFFVNSKNRKIGGVSTLAAFAALSDLSWLEELEGDDHSDSLSVEEQLAMATIQVGAIPTPLTKHTHDWNEGQNNPDPTNFQRAADYYMRKALKMAFAPIASTTRKDISGAQLVTYTSLNTTSIVWWYPEQGVWVLDLFGGINIGLAAVLQEGIHVHQYLYVEKDEIAQRASLKHVALLMHQYPDLLPMAAVQAYQHQLPQDVSLLGAQDFARVGEINLVIAG
jgi:hypothetical protein